MKTIKEWVMTLPEDIREKALKYEKYDWNDKSLSLAYAILEAFIWRETEEGTNYWRNIWQRADSGDFAQKGASPNKTQVEQINEIMDWFDFDKVHRAMQALNWTWYGKDVPLVGQIRKQARELLTEVANTDASCVSTGGLKASKTDGILFLEFVVEYWEAETPTKYEQLKEYDRYE